MASHLTHSEIQELLGVYAIDAVDPDEALLIDEHLRTCPRCRAEVTDHREAAALLSFSGTSAPADLWGRIAADLEASPPPLDLSRARALRRTRLPRLSLVAAAAAVSVIGLLGAQVVQQGNRIDELSAVFDQTGLDQAAAAAAVDPEARTVTLESDDGSRVVRAIVLPNGQGYLVQANLPRLGAEQTYQLWGVMGAQTVSLGVLGEARSIVPFVASGPLTALAITAERSGGVIASTNAPLVQGFLSA
ncbi:MAG: anti-sigma factor [Acidimicrobiales bacterium]